MWTRVSPSAETYAAADGKAGTRLRALEAEAVEAAIPKVLDPEEIRRMRQASDPHYKVAAAAHVDGDNTAKRKVDPAAAGAGAAAADGEPPAKRARADGSEVDPDAPSGGAEPDRPPLPSDPVVGRCRLNVN